MHDAEGPGRNIRNQQDDNQQSGEWSVQSWSRHVIQARRGTSREMGADATFFLIEKRLRKRSAASFFSHAALNLLKGIKHLCRKNLGIYLSGLDIGVAKHLRHDFDGDSGRQCDGGGECVPSDVSGDILLDSGSSGNGLQVAVVDIVCEMRELEVISEQHITDRGKDKENESRA